ncbi:ankyrin repeat protein [Delitschia confertaspora ATCC 74209]|uniref:Ankyrin repeat protein n=1 Tax=Delitschia confertaspora ATCC 74209 TaxID=1513339 RepID=A0A9P4JS07_9PLEO|nr:ankyrin repeat protein [Delitschia confertaspora ATCC 74209]
MTTPFVLPSIPAKHADFILYIKENAGKHLAELLEPYKQYDAKLREVFAQQPDHPALSDHYLNVVPVYSGQEANLKIHARQLDMESPEEKEKYLMPLTRQERRPDGSPAIVQNLKEFQKNFSLFCESALVDLDWNNVVAAGSSVVTCLLPVPPKYNKSKRSLRKYYHEIIAPASDVDLFLYGLTEEEATKKILQIEESIKNSILAETTTIRTKNAITIASQYPNRHIQIVLRIYKSLSEILTGFDVDCSCAAYDGKNVYASPRALVAYMTQCNTIDLSRRSPSYESRLSKYSHRGFEVHWPILERSRIDPTIFERNFSRTVGLARLLVLERLPSHSDRESYMDSRRKERGRPTVSPRLKFSMRGNIKESHEDEIAEWVEQEDVSDYHTFTVPYGPRFNAKTIEKLLFTKDLLLNAEWNKPEDREVNLHRHPAFFGHTKDIIHDCCGFCPQPKTPEEHDVAEVESKIYVSGEISFIKDNPGRQAIGSFNPITDNDWTEMAYVGNTARLCQAIIDGDLEHVEDWLDQEGADPNCRDYTGRTPLHLATMCSTLEVVAALINHGARLIARLADGRTALHIASARGSVEMVKTLLQKSEANEEEEAKREDARKKARSAARVESTQTKDIKLDDADDMSESSEQPELIDHEDSEDLEDDDQKSTTTGSFLKVKGEEKVADDLIPEDRDEPDIYDVNILQWDTQCSPLHLAILYGHVEVVKELVQTFGADVLLPIKLMVNSYGSKSPRGAILTLALAQYLPLEKAKAMTQTLLELGASSAQADTNQTTALHYISFMQLEVLDTLFQYDAPAAMQAINHLRVTGIYYNTCAQSPLMTAIMGGNSLTARKLLEAGATTSLKFNDWIKAFKAQFANQDVKSNYDVFLRQIDEPITLAVRSDLPDIVLDLLARGVDPNTLSKEAKGMLIDSTNGSTYYGSYLNNDEPGSLLDTVRRKVKDLKRFEEDYLPIEPKPLVNNRVDYLANLTPGSYQHFVAQIQLEKARQNEDGRRREYEKRLENHNSGPGMKEKLEAVKALRAEYEKVESILVDLGAKSFEELHPGKTVESPFQRYNLMSQNLFGFGQGNNPRESELFKVAFNFPRVPNLTAETREAYLKLFQAAWDGDLPTIELLTLSSWGPDNDQTPLKIAVEDDQKYTPFSLAVLRGHFDVATTIVQIAFAQYQCKGKRPKEMYKMISNGDDDYSDEGSEESRSDDDEDDFHPRNIQVHKEIIDHKFTIENVGELSTQVKSDVSPLKLMELPCNVSGYWRIIRNRTLQGGIESPKSETAYPTTLVSWAIATNDMPTFTFLLKLNQEWTRKLHSLDEVSSAIPKISDADFESAMSLGRLQMLTEMIKLTGAGMELESLVKSSKVKLEETPKFYQGLSVHGKKRADWAAAARRTPTPTVTESSPPLLRAAFKGGLESVEWFLSDASARYYREFMEANLSDKHIEHFSSCGGLEKVLSKWLRARRELVIHCAVMAHPSGESHRLIKYLLKTVPESLETKSISGYTPLALAFHLKRLEAARILVDAGADQTIRDNWGNNLLHLVGTSPIRPGESPVDYQAFFDLIDRRLLVPMLSERSAINPGSCTPLARHVYYSQRPDVIEQLLKLAEPTDNKHLELLDGSGHTPIHAAVQHQQLNLLKLMLEHRPDLLYRENATGKTAMEMAEDAYIASRVADVPILPNQFTRMDIREKSPNKFVEEEEESESGVERVWKVCKAFMEKYPGKRRMVSLADANEVANRLATNYRRKSTYLGQNGGNDDESDAEKGLRRMGEDIDEVQQWLYSV